MIMLRRVQTAISGSGGFPEPFVRMGCVCIDLKNEVTMLELRWGEVWRIVGKLWRQRKGSSIGPEN